MEKKTPDLKFKARFFYESGRFVHAIKWQVYPLVIIILSYLFNSMHTPPIHLIGILLSLSVFGLWKGLDWAKGVRHGLLLGSVGLMMPVLQTLMDSIPHLYHTLLCILIGMAISILLWYALIQRDQTNIFSPFYSGTCIIMTFTTASLCCYSIGLGSVAGITLGLLSLSGTQYLYRYLNRN